MCVWKAKCKNVKIKMKDCRLKNVWRYEIFQVTSAVKLTLSQFFNFIFRMLVPLGNKKTFLTLSALSTLTDYCCVHIKGGEKRERE